MTPTQSLVLACASVVVLTFIVGVRMFQVRVREMRKERIHPQSLALSQARSQKLTDSRASDNFNNLLEIPILFYALCIAAIAAQHTPVWLAALAWVFVALRVVHSWIQCTYNKVMHRFRVFVLGYLLVTGMWVAFAISFITT